jgi:hypothetical protein
MPSIRSTVAFLALVAVSSAFASPPQSLPLDIKEGKLAGAGADLLRAQLPQAQFILWGEDHGFADSPVLLRALAREARPLGFKYHIVEVGPLSTRMIADALSHGGLDGLHKLVHEVPLGMPFLCLRDDAELASDFLGNDSKGQPFLRGIDQEFIGSPAFHLQRLVALAPDDAARTTAETLLREEQDAAAKGAHEKFLLTRFRDADFDRLAAQFKGQPEAQEIIAELKESAAIYQAWASGRNYENNARRARLLAKNFLAAYKSAADPEPKVVFKMGLEHTALGTNTNNMVDVGTLATSIATLNGKSSLRIAFLPMAGHNAGFAIKPGNPVSIEPYESGESKEFFAAIGLEPAALPKEGWALVPLEPIRQSLDTKGLNKLKAFARTTLLGYDYVVTTADAKAATSLY